MPYAQRLGILHAVDDVASAAIHLDCKTASSTTAAVAVEPAQPAAHFISYEQEPARESSSQRAELFSRHVGNPDARSHRGCRLIGFARLLRGTPTGFQLRFDF